MYTCSLSFVVIRFHSVCNDVFFIGFIRYFFWLCVCSVTCKMYMYKFAFRYLWYMYYALLSYHDLHLHVHVGVQYSLLYCTCTFMTPSCTIIVAEWCLFFLVCINITSNAFSLTCFFPLSSCLFHRLSLNYLLLRLFLDIFVDMLLCSVSSIVFRKLCKWP